MNIQPVCSVTRSTPRLREGRRNRGSWRKEISEKWDPQCHYLESEDFLWLARNKSAPLERIKIERTVRSHATGRMLRHSAVV